MKNTEKQNKNYFNYLCDILRSENLHWKNENKKLEHEEKLNNIKDLSDIKSLIEISKEIDENFLTS
jgi:hypothetical protein